MLRLLILTLTIGLFPALAQACEISTGKRATMVADYVAQGRACLTAPPEAFSFSEAMEAAFVKKINQERAKRGLKALKVRKSLRPAARFHSLDMGVNGFFGHETPRGRTHPQRISAFDRTLIASVSAENVARLEMKCEDRSGRSIPCTNANISGPDPMQGAVNELHRQLMDSPGHRANILAEDTTHVSVGVARTTYGVYATQNFVKVAGEFDRPVPLTLTAGTRPPVNAVTYDWDYKRLALMMRSGSVSDLNEGVIPSGTRGDMDLSVRGEKPTSDRGFRYIYLPGPSVTIGPPRGS